MSSTISHHHHYHNTSINQQLTEKTKNIKSNHETQNKLEANSNETPIAISSQKINQNSNNFDEPSTSLFVQSQVPLKNSSFDLNETKVAIQNFLNYNKTTDSTLLSNESSNDKKLTQEQNDDLLKKFLTINKMFDKKNKTDEFVQNDFKQFKDFQSSSNKMYNNHFDNKISSDLQNASNGTEFYNKMQVNNNTRMFNNSKNLINPIANLSIDTNLFNKVNQKPEIYNSSVFMNDNKEKKSELIKEIKTSFFENITQIEGAALVCHFIETIRRELVAGKNCCIKYFYKNFINYKF